LLLLRWLQAGAEQFDYCGWPDNPDISELAVAEGRLSNTDDSDDRTRLGTNIYEQNFGRGIKPAVVKTHGVHEGHNGGSDDYRILKERVANKGVSPYAVYQSNDLHLRSLRVCQVPNRIVDGADPVFIYAATGTARARISACDSRASIVMSA